MNIYEYCYVILMGKTIYVCVYYIVYIYIYNYIIIYIYVIFYIYIYIFNACRECRRPPQKHVGLGRQAAPVRFWRVGGGGGGLGLHI